MLQEQFRIRNYPVQAKQFVVIRHFSWRKPYINFLTPYPWKAQVATWSLISCSNDLGCANVGLYNSYCEMTKQRQKAIDWFRQWNYRCFDSENTISHSIASYVTLSWTKESKTKNNAWKRWPPVFDPQCKQYIFLSLLKLLVFLPPSTILQNYFNFFISYFMQGRNFSSSFSRCRCRDFTI